jgi:hypothetical protein
LLVALVAVLGRAGAQDLPAPLNVPSIPQTNFFWCWAASASMITAYYSRPIEQCQFVSDAKETPGCCNSGQHYSVCNFAGLPDFTRYHFSASETETPLLWPAIVSEIGARRPFVFTLRGATISHMLVVRGVQIITGAQALLVNDPDGQLPAVTYDGYRKQHGVTIAGISPLPVTR